MKDVPNGVLRTIKLENNDMKSVTNSRDTQEVPFDKGTHMLNIFRTFDHKSTILEARENYDESNQKPKQQPQPPQQQQQQQRSRSPSVEPKQDSPSKDKNDSNNDETTTTMTTASTQQEINVS